MKNKTYGKTPEITSCVLLAPELPQRFAAILRFANGEVGKYVLPIDRDLICEDTVEYQDTIFTDEIWRSGTFDKHALRFNNGFTIYDDELYADSTTFREPVIHDEIVYEDGEIQIKLMAEWKNCFAFWQYVCSDSKIDFYKILVEYHEKNNSTKEDQIISIFLNPDGTRASNLDFTDVWEDRTWSGLAKASVVGFDYGFINEDITFSILPKYCRVDPFYQGYAFVYEDSRITGFIDTRGTFTMFPKDAGGNDYEKICSCQNGMFRVSNFIESRGFKLAYTLWPRDALYMAPGCWGFVNTKGQEIIKPQYIFASDFSNGIARVCKGELELSTEACEDRCESPIWHIKDARWGIIDKDGNEIIPCKYEKIGVFFDGYNSGFSEQYFPAYFDSGEKTGWGVIDRTGRLIDERLFPDIADALSKDGLFAFYSTVRHSSSNNEIPMGIYSISDRRVILEPQYSEILFEEDGVILVKEYSERYNRTVQKLIDCSGRSLFESKYSQIEVTSDPYIAVIFNVEDGEKQGVFGLIDKNGNELVPCRYDYYWDEISYERGCIIFRDTHTKEYGLKDFNSNILIPARYDYLDWIEGTDFLCCQTGDGVDAEAYIIHKDGTRVLGDKATYFINPWGDTIITNSKSGSKIYQITKR